MTDPTGPAPSYSGGALARIVAVHQRDGEVARDQTPVLSRAWDRALRRAGAAFKGLSLVPGSVVATERVTLADGLDGLPETGLVAALEDRNGQRGLIGVSHGVVDALIEVQTTGKVEARALPPRPVTRIDEALSRDFLDLTLAAWTHETSDQDERDWPERMVFGSSVPDRRQLPLLMPDQEYHLMSATVSLGDEASREGQVMLLLPCTRPSNKSTKDLATGRKAAAEGAREQPVAWKLAMDEAMQDAELRLDAVLLRTKRSLYNVERLAPGDLIHFGPADLASVRLETPGGRYVLTGRLGQIGGLRALRVVAPVGTAPVNPEGPGALSGARASGDALAAIGLGHGAGAGSGAFSGGGAATGDVDPMAEAAIGGMPMGGLPAGGPGEGSGLEDGGFPGPPLPDLPEMGGPGMDGPGFGDLPDPGFPGPGAGALPDLPGMDPPGGADDLPMASPAPLDFMPQSAPFNLDDLPE
jgi:flagellar motor switch protein FliM